MQAYQFTDHDRALMVPLVAAWFDEVVPPPEPTQYYPMPRQDLVAAALVLLAVCQATIEKYAESPL